MSEQDQIQIVGRLTLQAAELRKKSAFVNAELENALKDFDVLVQSLRSMVGRRIINRDGSAHKLEVRDYVRKYADVSKLNDLLSEQDRLWTEAEEIRAKLSELGA